MNRLTLCQGAQEALCSEVTHAARRGSWQWWGTTSMGYQVLSCPQWHESGATESHKGQEARGVLVHNMGNRDKESTELRGTGRGKPEPLWLLPHSQDFSCLCPRSVPQDVEVTSLNCCGERAGGSFPYLHL